MQQHDCRKKFYLQADATRQLQTRGQRIETKKRINTTSRLRHLSPFLDEDGLLISQLDYCMRQSVISGSLTLSDTKIRDFGVKFYFSKFRMEPVMLSFLATTENTK